MEIVNIEGATRTIGESQGYISLPLRDVLVNCTVGGEGTPAMQSAWQPSADEVAMLLRGGVIVLTVLGTAHPPVMLEAALGAVA
jgi:hypothetical protein